MKRIIFKISAVLCTLAFFASPQAQAQCTNAPNGQYPAATFTPSCIGSPETITALAWTGEYSVLTLTAGVTYTFTSSVATDYLTVTDNAVTPIVFGVGPLAFNCPTSGTYRIYRHNNAACATQNTSRTISVQCGTPPPPVTNDDCSSVTPTVLVNGAGATTFNGTTLGGTASSIENTVLGYGAVWEAVTLTGTCNQLTVNFCGTPAGNMDGNFFIVYTDCPLSTYTVTAIYDFTSCGDGNGTMTFLNLPAGTYYLPVIIDGSSNTLGAYTMNVSSIDCPPPPVNDDCAMATTVSCGVYTGSTASATPDPAAPVCGGNVTSNGVWYMIQGTGQTFTVSLCGSGYDTYIHAYSGSCAALTCITSNDDFCGASSQISLPTVIGTNYYILINGYNANSGPYTLTVTASAPSNDACAAATVIAPGTYTGNTACATTDVAPTCGGSSDDASGGVWYSYTTSCSGNITASLCTGTTYNTQLRVFSGTCGALVCEAGNDDGCGTQSTVSWAGAPSTTYYILVYGEGESGPFTLNVSQVDNIAPVPNVASLTAINSTCSVTLTAPTATDNCVGSVTGTTPQMTYSANGTYNVIWTYNDGNGNTSTQSQAVTINDNIAPTVICNNDTVVDNDPGDCGAVVNYIEPACLVALEHYNQPDNAILDNGFFMGTTGPRYLADDFNVPAGDCWNISEITANIWEAVPAGSLTSLQVTILNDAGGIPGTSVSSQALNSSNWNINATLGAAFGYTVEEFSLMLPTSVNVCGGVSGATFWLSLHDNTGPTSTAWSNSLPVNGYTAKTSPSLSGPWADVLDVATPNDFVFSIIGEITGPVSDNCPDCPTVVQTAGLPSGSLFPVGITTNTFEITDNGGNTTTCSFDVTVNDTQAPVPNASETFTFTDGAINVAVQDLQTVSDSVLVSGLPTVLNTGDLSTVCININHTYVSDMSISLISPSGTVFDLSSGNGGSGDNYTNTCFDMSAAASIVGATAPFSGSYIPEGAGGFDVFNSENPNGYWKIQIYDAFNGDQGTLTNFALTFEYIDNLPTVMDECSVTLSVPTASDNCLGSVNGITSNGTTYTAEGTHIVTWTYTDSNGNVSTQTQQVIIDDVTAPVPNNPTLAPLTGNCLVNLTTVPTATDNCIGSINATTTDPLSYNSAGTYVVTWTYDDGRGNTSTQTQTVTVIDTISPVPNSVLLPNIVGNCSVTVENPPTATDNCAGTITATTTDPLLYDLIGTFFIIWHFDDGNGNTWTQNQTVVVNPCLGIEEESGQWNVLIYPNPSSGAFTLSFAEMPSENTEIKLVNNLGQVLYSGIQQSQNQQYDFSYLASGSYHLLIQNENGKISRQIIIHQNY